MNKQVCRSLLTRFHLISWHAEMVWRSKTEATWREKCIYHFLGFSCFFVDCSIKGEEWKMLI